MSNQGHEVEIREFKEDGLDDTTLKFREMIGANEDGK